MTITAHVIATAILFWFAASAATFILTTTLVMYWWRVRVSHYYRAKANATAARIRALPADYPTRLRTRLRTRYWLERASVDAPFCNACVGWWAHLLAVTVGWLYLGAPGHLGGFPAPVALPGVLCASWLLWLVASQLLPGGDSNAIPDQQGVEDEPAGGR